MRQDSHAHTPGSGALPLVASACLAAAALAAPAPLPAIKHRIAVIAHRGGRDVAPENTLAAFRSAIKMGADYIEIDVRATAFQMRVWNYLQSIPYGEVQSYSEVAEAIGQPTAARAVAGACASNTVALAIPCHRVIRGSGELGGYRWGLDRKRALIDLERRANSR